MARAASVLNEIAERRTADLAAELGDRPLAEVASSAPAGPARRDVVGRLARTGLHLIAEIKRSSPSAGSMVDGELDVAEIDQPVIRRVSPDYFQAAVAPGVAWRMDHPHLYATQIKLMAIFKQVQVTRTGIVKPGFNFILEPVVHRTVGETIHRHQPLDRLKTETIR